MKKAINGVRYDTEKASEIGRFNNGLDRLDFQFWEAGLYVSQRGSYYFLAGEGGPMTRYGASRGNSLEWNGSFGERIDPMSKEKAFEWAKVYLSPEEVNNHFGDMKKQ